MNEPRTVFFVVAAAVITGVIAWQAARHVSQDEVIRQELADTKARAATLAESLENCRSSLRVVRPGHPIGSPLGAADEPQPTLAR